MSDLFDDPPITRRGDSIVQPMIAFNQALSEAQVEAITEAWERGWRPEGYPAKARTTDVHTSHEAAGAITHLARKHRAGILAALAIYGPQTGHEIAARLGLTEEITWIPVSKRLPELREQGTIERRETGTHNGKPLYHTRLSPSGRQACVWYVVGTPNV